MNDVKSNTFVVWWPDWSAQITRYDKHWNISRSLRFLSGRFHKLYFLRGQLNVSFNHLRKPVLHIKRLLFQTVLWKKKNKLWGKSWVGLRCPIILTIQSYAQISEVNVRSLLVTHHTITVFVIHIWLEISLSSYLKCWFFFVRWRNWEAHWKLSGVECRSVRALSKGWH